MFRLNIHSPSQDAEETRAPSRNVGKTTFLPSEVVNKRTFHILLAMPSIPWCGQQDVTCSTLEVLDTPCLVQNIHNCNGTHNTYTIWQPTTHIHVQVLSWISLYLPSPRQGLLQEKHTSPNSWKKKKKKKEIIEGEKVWAFSRFSQTHTKIFLAATHSKNSYSRRVVTKYKNS